jgi:hypothetical protein
VILSYDIQVKLEVVDEDAGSNMIDALVEKIKLEKYLSIKCIDASVVRRPDKVLTSIEDVKCPDCDGPMVSRKSQYGVFWGCKKYPKCKGTRDSMGRTKEEAKLERDRDKQSEDVDRTPVDPAYTFKRE